MILKRLLDISEISAAIAAAIATSSSNTLRSGGGGGGGMSSSDSSRTDIAKWRDATRRLTSASTGSDRFLKTWESYVGSVEIVRTNNQASTNNSSNSGNNNNSQETGGNRNDINNNHSTMDTSSTNNTNGRSGTNENKSNTTNNVTSENNNTTGRNRNNIERMYFEIPVPILDTLSNPSFLESRSRFVHHLAKIPDYSDRMQDLHFRGNLLILESMYLAKLRKRSPTLHFFASNEMLWMNLTFILASSINILDVLTDSPGKSFENRLICFLGFLHVLFTCLRYIAYATNRYRTILNERFVKAEDKRRRGRHVTDHRSYNIFDPFIKLFIKIKAKLKETKEKGFYNYLRCMFCFLLPKTSASKQQKEVVRHREYMKSMSKSASNKKEKSMEKQQSENETWKKTVVPFHDPHKSLSTFEIVKKIFRGCAYQNFYAAVTAIAFMFNCWAQIEELNRQYFWRFARMSFYSLCLLDICVRNASLERVLAAVKLNRSQLGQTALLMIVLIYIYTTFIFWAFKDDFIDGSSNADPSDGSGKGQYKRCQTIAQCLVTAYDEGLRQDVGLAEYLVGLQTYGEDARPVYVVALRLLLDVGWWVAITLLLVNIVAGVIIDAFAELRDIDKRLQSMLDTKCLVCGCDASELNTRGSGYRSHLKDEHNLWNYVWLRLALRTKVEAGLSKKRGKQSLYGRRSTEFTGQESYVWSMIEDDDRSYLPQRQAMCFLPSNSVGNNSGGNNGGSQVGYGRS